MLDIKNCLIDGMNFRLIPLPALKALRLDKKVLALVLPALGGFKNLDSEVNLEVLSKGVSESLTHLPDSDFENLAIELLSSVTYLPENGSPVELTSTEQINSIFPGKLMTIYKLMFEVMRFNKFSPFVLMEGDGSLIKKISGFQKQDVNNQKNGKQSEKLGL